MFVMRVLVIRIAVAAGLVLSMGACGPAVRDRAEPAKEPPSAGVVAGYDAALDAIVAADARIEKLQSHFMFTEGPLWTGASRAALLFSDVRGNAIYRWDAASGEISDFSKPNFAGEYEEGRFIGPNGLTLDAQRRVVACEHGNRRIVRFEADGSRTVLADKYRGKRLNSPNDIVYKSDGWAYFTDPPYGLAGGDEDPDKDLAFNGIYRLSPDGEVELLNRELTRPNGLAFSPDEKTLYVANSDPRRKIWMAYPVRDDGRLGEGRVFYDATAVDADGLPDGLKTDTKGNLYLTGPGGVWIFTPGGKHLGTIRPEETPSNVGWGDDGHMLYITARGGLYRIRLLAEGRLP